MPDGSTSFSAYRTALAQAQTPVYQPQTQIVQQPPQNQSVWQSYRQILAPQVQQGSVVESAVMGTRFTLESAFVGAVLGLIHGKVGLDIAGKYPVDGIAAAILLWMSIKDQGPISEDLRALSQSCTTIATFRKTSDWASGPRAPSAPRGNEPITGNTNVDPLVEVARKYGL